MADEPAVTSLDVIDLRCPLPVLMARKALNRLPAGAVLEVLASDPAASQDFSAFCQATGHQLIGESAEDGVQRFLIQKVTGSV